ncbi:MAG: GxxExxY protein [Enterobacterales bacterium]|nr:GxxExxY protein [Enterobacterales bacterium]
MNSQNQKHLTTKGTKNTKENQKILFKDECYQIQGAIFDVYREMGCGFLEAVYQECLEKELTARGIPFVSQPELNLLYKGKNLTQKYRPDIICYNQIIIELKAVKKISPIHKAQLMNYLKVTKLKLGLLINFLTNTQKYQ